MQLSPYVAQVRAALESAAALGDDHTRSVASGLAGAADPAVRLALVAAVSAAADEITAALLDAPGAPSVTARLGADAGGDTGPPGLGGELQLDVRTGTETAAPPPDDGDSSARISLRLPEALKTEIEAAARGEAVSVNTWLVRAAAAAVRTSSRGTGSTSRSTRTGGGAAHVTGWING